MFMLINIISFVLQTPVLIGTYSDSTNNLQEGQRMYSLLVTVLL